jgi:hypothetical protein
MNNVMTCNLLLFGAQWLFTSPALPFLNFKVFELTNDFVLPITERILLHTAVYLFSRYGNTLTISHFHGFPYHPAVCYDVNNKPLPPNNFVRSEIIPRTKQSSNVDKPNSVAYYTARKMPKASAGCHNNYLV